MRTHPARAAVRDASAGHVPVLLVLIVAVLALGLPGVLATPSIARTGGADALSAAVAPYQVSVPANALFHDVPADFYLPMPAAGAIDPKEQAMFDAVNAARADAGIAALRWDPELGYIARVRTTQMGEQGYFSHTDPAGYRMWVELLALSGIRYEKAGENLAGNDYADADTVTLAMAELLASPTHRENLLDPDLTHVGIGVFETAEGYRYYAQIFSAPRE
ncbi:MAG: CAP domain-containing protein [Tepidiformaceae bacterium]